MLFSKFISNLFLFSMINITITTNYILKNNLLYLQEIIERNIANIGRTTQKDIVSKSNNYIHNIHTHTSHQEITPLKEKKETNENHKYIYIYTYSCFTYCTGIQTAVTRHGNGNRRGFIAVSGQRLSGRQQWIVIERVSVRQEHVNGQRGGILRGCAVRR